MKELSEELWQSDAEETETFAVDEQYEQHVGALGALGIINNAEDFIAAPDNAVTLCVYSVSAK